MSGKSHHILPSTCKSQRLDYLKDTMCMALRKLLDPENLWFMLQLNINLNLCLSGLKICLSHTNGVKHEMDYERDIYKHRQ